MRLEVICYIVKISGIFCIVAGCTGIGFLKSRELKSRIDYLRGFQKKYMELQNEIRYLSIPLTEIFENIADRCHDDYRDFFLEVGKNLCQKNCRNIEHIWKKAVQTCLLDSPLEQTDLCLISEIGEHIGYLDKKAQLSAMEFYMERLNTIITDLSGQAANQKRLYESLGIFSGLILTLCLI